MNKKGLMGFLFLILIIGIILCGAYFSYSSIEHLTITVKDKERINDGDGSKYLIFTPTVHCCIKGS